MSTEEDVFKRQADMAKARNGLGKRINKDAPQFQKKRYQVAKLEQTYRSGALPKGTIQVESLDDVPLEGSKSDNFGKSSFS